MLSVRLGVLIFAAGLAVAQVPPDSQQFSSGRRAIMTRQWQAAADSFGAVSARHPSRDEALYWRAFALMRLGNGSEARAALDEFRANYPNSRWMGAARRLESASPGDIPEQEERKLALDLQHTLMRDPAAAVEEARRILATPWTSDLHNQIVSTLGRSKAPEVREYVGQLARGEGSPIPDVQRAAISLYGRYDPAGLIDLYWTNSDRLAVIWALHGQGRKGDLVQIASRETDRMLRSLALSHLIQMGAQAEALAAAESTPGGRKQVEQMLKSASEREAMNLRMARSASDPVQRRSAVMNLSQGVGDAVPRELRSMYPEERSPEIKQAIIVALRQRKAFPTLAELGREENDLEFKRQIIQALLDSEEHVKQMLK
jgi:hypothetical protein